MPSSQSSITLDPPDFSACYVGWGDEEEARIYDCRTWPNKYKARADYAASIGEPVRECHVRVIYARWLSSQEQWDDYGRERWNDMWLDVEMDERGARYVDGDWRYPDGTPLPEEGPDAPEEPPENWEPDEEDPVWVSCKRTDEGAVRCWRVEWAG
jgi:hypothetical protein